MQQFLDVPVDGGLVTLEGPEVAPPVVDHVGRLAIARRVVHQRHEADQRIVGVGFEDRHDVRVGDLAAHVQEVLDA